MRLQVSLKLMMTMVAAVAIGIALVMHNARLGVVLYLVVGMPIVLRLLDGVFHRLVASTVCTWIPATLFFVAVIRALNVEGNQVNAADVAFAAYLGLIAGAIAGLISGTLDFCGFLYRYLCQKLTFAASPDEPE